MTDVITSDDFDTKVLGSHLPVLMKLGATWCGPCGIMNPIMDELSAELDGKVAVVSVDVDESSDIAMDLDVANVPMFVSFNNGRVKGSIVGAMTKQDLVRWLISTLSEPSQ